MKIRKISLVCCFFILPGALLFTWVLNHYPEYFPTLPQGLAIKLAVLYGAQNAEQIADLEVILGFIIGLVLFGILSLVLFGFKKSKNEF